MRLNTATALLVTLLVTSPIQGADTFSPTSVCIYHLILEGSSKFDDALRSLTRKSVWESAQRSWVTVHVKYKKLISSEKIAEKIRNYNRRNNTQFKTPTELKSDFIFANDPFIIESLTDLAAIDEVKKITLVSSIDVTNNQLDIVASKHLSYTDTFKASQFKNEPKVTAEFPSDYLSREEMRQAATMAIYAASKKAQFPAYETNPVAVSLKTELTTSTYNDDKTIYTRGATIAFTVKFTTPGANEPNIHVAVSRNSITGAFDYARVH